VRTVGPRFLPATMLGMAALLVQAPADAGQFSISPLRLDLAAGATTAALTVRNDEATPVVIQGQGLAWSQEGGQDTLTPSRDLLISPVVFTLPAGGSQLVRVALRGAPDTVRELAYRITLQEVPQPAAPGFTGLQVALRLSLPVFVAPASPATPELRWAASRLADGRLHVVAHNDGLAHARIRRFVVKPGPDAATAFEQATLAYVLPGASRQWTFGEQLEDPRDLSPAKSGVPAAATTTAGQVQLEGTTDEGEFATELKLAAE